MIKFVNFHVILYAHIVDNQSEATIVLRHEQIVNEFVANSRISKRKLRVKTRSKITTNGGGKHQPIFGL